MSKSSPKRENTTFFSRPRRFGKSLFLDILRQAFLGRRELFEGLFLEKHRDWSRKPPVIYISFGAGVVEDEDQFTREVLFILERQQEELGIRCKYFDDYKTCLYELVIRASEKFKQKVIVLVDEYDKPILDRIEDRETAIKIRERLKNLYSILKDADPYLELFITGVTKFSKVSLFSGLNNLKYITYTPPTLPFAGIPKENLKKPLLIALKILTLPRFAAGTTVITSLALLSITLLTFFCVLRAASFVLIGSRPVLPPSSSSFSWKNISLFLISKTLKPEKTFSLPLM